MKPSKASSFSSVGALEDHPPPINAAIIKVSLTVIPNFVSSLGVTKGPRPATHTLSLLILTRHVFPDNSTAVTSRRPLLEAAAV